MEEGCFWGQLFVGASQLGDVGACCYYYVLDR